MTSQENGKTTEIYSIPFESDQKKEESKKKFWHIDKEMIRFKLHYFMFMGGLSMTFPYISVYARNEIGLSASSLAAILMMEQFLFVVTKPMLGYLADYFNMLKTIICFLTVGETIFFLLLLTITKIDRGTENFVNRSSFVFPLKHFNFSDLTFKERQHYQKNIISGEDIINNNMSNLILSYHLLKPVNECTVYTTERTAVSNNWNSFENISLNNYLPFLSVENNALGADKISSKSILSSFCRIYWNSKGDCYLVPCEVFENHSEVSPETASKSDFLTYQFWLFALLTATAITCGGALFTLSDTACCESVEKTGAEFGRQRLWGAISWGIICPLGGLLNDITGDYLASFTLKTFFAALTVWNILKLDLVKPHFSQNILKDVFSVFKSKEFLSFEISVLLNGISTGFVWFYLMWFLAAIGGCGFLLGVTQAVQCFVGEIPCMFFSGWMINKMGHFNIMSLSLLSYAIRFMWYSLLQNPWLVLPVEWLHGITYGVYYAAVASYAKKSAKPGTEATTQSVLFTTHEGIGAGIGCVLAGIGFDTFGGHRTFLLVSIFSACGTVLSIILHLCIRCQKGSLNVTPSTDK